ncbi:galactose-3-O-sulfotransferase 2-like [Branchiostoma floridae x Branchiostoma belcheri]
MSSSMTGKTVTSWRNSRSILAAFAGLCIIVTIYFQHQDSLSPIPSPKLHKMKNSPAAKKKQEYTEETEVSTNFCSRPRQKYVFIAPHKVGASTSCPVFMRYAIRHRLAVLIPTKGNVLSWGVSPVEEDYIHTPDEQYDALLNHFTYNKTWLRSKFPADTAYISIIRNPIEQLRSTMNYYYLPKLLKIKSKNPLNTFLENPWRYKNRSEVHVAYCNVTWDPSRNFMSFDLGYPAEGAEDKERARRYIHELEADFTLIMLLDYVDESYVLLKRLMCWELQDVLYKANNVRSYTFKSFVPSEKELEELRRWKAVDYLLYDTFNKSLWRKIAAQGPDFFEEVRHFKDLNERINTHCGKRQRKELTVKASKWNSQFEVDAEFCSALHSVVREFLIPLQKGPQGDRFKLVTEKQNIKAVIDGQPTFKYETEKKKYLHEVKAARKSKRMKRKKLKNKLKRTAKRSVRV